MKIIVVCGAGASSTFVALRIRRSAADRGLSASVTVTPTSESVLLAELADPVLAALHNGAVLLLGAHLKGRADALGSAASTHGITTAVMPESVFTAADGNAALDLALEVAGAAS